MTNLQKIKEFIDNVDKSAPNLITQIVLTLLILAILLLVRKGALNFIKYNLSDQQKYKTWKRTFSIFALSLYILILLPMWLPSLTTFATFLGIFGAGTLIVFKEVIMSMAAWILIMVRRPFEIGNRISICGYYGDVLDIRILEFTLIEVNVENNENRSSGRVIHIPNHKIFVETLRNASQSFAFNWHEINIALSLKSDWKLAISIVEALALKLAPQISPDDERIQDSRYKYDISYGHLTPRVYTKVEHGKIILTLRFLCEPRKIADTSDKLWREILKSFAPKKIKIQLSNF